MTIEKINPPALPSPIGYTQVVATSGTRTIYIAGQVAVDAIGNVVAPGDVIGQAVARVRQRAVRGDRGRRRPSRTS